MSDLNKHAERAEAKRTARIAAIRAVSYLPLADQRDALLDALVEVEAQIKSSGEKDADPPARKARNVFAGVFQPTLKGADEASENSVTESVTSALRNAKGRGLTAREVAKLIYPSGTEADNRRVLQTLTRLHQKKSKPLHRQGRAGGFRYSLRGGQETAKSLIAQKTAPLSANEDDTLVARILTAIQAGPTRDYALLAEKLLGGAQGDNKVKIRNTIYYLHREKKLKKRADGAWEAA